jgi:LacI family transcriptional regulator
MALCPTDHEHDREVSLLERLMQGTTDGALLILPEESPDEVIADPLRPLDERVPTVSAAITGSRRRPRSSRSTTCLRSA